MERIMRSDRLTYAAPGVDFSGAYLITDLFSRFAEWRRLARERRRLSGLDARMLRDIGVAADAAATEAARPFWDAPRARR
jgi:uncharacterized protein YjiS (DUF1127 family)